MMSEALVATLELGKNMRMKYNKLRMTQWKDDKSLDPWLHV